MNPGWYPRNGGEGEVMELESFRVLIVDDEEDFIDTLTKRLKMRQIRVEGVYSGTAALDFLGRNPMDVVVLDVRMPDMDGIEVLREIKHQHPLVEVIMLTGHANLEVAIEGMRLGAFDYLLKPIEIDQLLYKLQDAYQKKSIQDQKIEKEKKAIHKRD
jgi:DNA-binding NtrC family response regulator